MSNQTIEAIRELAQKINSFDLLVQCKFAEKMAQEIAESCDAARAGVDEAQWNRAREAYVFSQIDFCEKNGVRYSVGDFYADFDEHLARRHFEQQYEAEMMAAYDHYCDGLGLDNLEAGPATGAPVSFDDLPF